MPKKKQADKKTNEPLLKWLPCKKLQMLKRNPQYLSPKQMDALKQSIRRDGFVAPILVRSLNSEQYEVVSGNHRLMAALELEVTRVPCIISEMSQRDAQRLAVNLNLIHGDPPAELLAPFLAEMDDEILREIHLENGLKKELIEYDDILAKTLAKLDKDLDRISNPSSSQIPTCRCDKCGRLHVPSSDDRTNTQGPNES